MASCSPRRDQRADVLAENHALDVPLDLEVEDLDRNSILHAEGHRGRVHDLETRIESLAVRQRLQEVGLRIRVRVRVVDPVHLRRFQQDVGVDLVGAQGRGRVGREEGIPGPGDEEDDSPLLEMAEGAATDERLRDLPDLDGRHQTRGHASLLEGILKRQAVDHGGEQAHVVAGDAVDSLRRGRHPADDVSATEDDRGLDPERMDLADLVGHAGDDLRRDAEPLVPHERLSRELQEDASVHGGLGHRAGIIRETGGEV